MTLHDTVFARTSGYSGVSALVSTRVYPNQLPEDVTYPAITFVVPVSDNDAGYRTHDNVNNPIERSAVRVQFNCYATTPPGVVALGDQVVAAWSGYQDGCTVAYAFKDNRISDGWQPGINVYREIVDVIMDISI